MKRALKTLAMLVVFVALLYFLSRAITFVFASLGWKILLGLVALLLIAPIFTGTDLRRSLPSFLLCLCKRHKWSEWKDELNREERSCVMVRRCLRRGCGVTQKTGEHQYQEWCYEKEGSCNQIRNCRACGAREQRWDVRVHALEGCRCTRCGAVEHDYEKVGEEICPSGCDNGWFYGRKEDCTCVTCGGSGSVSKLQCKRCGTTT